MSDAYATLALSRNCPIRYSGRLGGHADQTELLPGASGAVARDRTNPMPRQALDPWLSADARLRN